MGCNYLIQILMYFEQYMQCDIKMIEGCINVSILNEEKRVQRTDFYDLKPLVEAEQVGEIKSSCICLDEESIKVLHIFLYYIMKVSRDLDLPNLQHQYHQQLNPYYLSHNLRINIIQFAFTSSKILPIKIQDCTHIIYYLMYGRLATPSYVSAICKGQGLFQLKEKVLKNTSTKQLKSKESKYFNTHKRSEVQENLSQIDILQHELQRILRPSKQEQNLQSTPAPKEKPKSQNSYGFYPDKNIRFFNTFFPKRVLNGEKSAILETRGDVRQKKVKFLRKKRFNEYYVGKWNKAMNDRDEVREKAVKEFLSFSLEKERKNRRQNFNYIIEQVRNSSSYLDRIRNTIEDNRSKIKKKINDKYISNYMVSEQENNSWGKESSKIEVEGKEGSGNQIEDQQVETQNPFTNLLRKDIAMKNQKSQQESGSGSSLKKQNRLFKFKSQYRRFLKKQLFREYD